MRFGPVEIRFGGKSEARGATLETETVPLSDATAIRQFFGIDDWSTDLGITVNADTVMGIPAFAAGVNFLANTIASLPFHEYQRTEDGPERVNDGMVAGMLAGTVNDDYLTSFKWRRWLMTSAMLTGAGRTYVEKDLGGKPSNLWPLDTKDTTKARRSGRTGYHVRDGGRTLDYGASEVVDVTWAEKLDGVSVYNPVERFKDTFALALAVEKYGARYFRGGGVPPLALEAAPASPNAMARAKTDVDAAIRKANKAGDHVVYLPTGAKLSQIGFEPSKGQLVEIKRFLIEEFARILNLSPIFLQDLTHGSFANTEQQDLHVVKHTITHWCEQIETECCAKFYGPRARSRYVEFNLDGLQRGDFKSRVEGWARAIQTSQATPAEARAAENRRFMAGSDVLLVQSATVPLELAGKQTTPTPPAEPDPGSGEIL